MLLNLLFKHLNIVQMLSLGLPRIQIPKTKLFCVASNLFVYFGFFYRFKQFNFFAGDINRPQCIPELSVFKSPNIHLLGTRPYFSYKGKKLVLIILAT